MSQKKTQSAITQHVIALSLAAIMTLGLLTSLGSMANTQYQSAQMVAQGMCVARA